MARRGVAGKGKGTHRDERETAARGDGNVGVVELGAGADAVAEAPGEPSAGDRGGLPSGDVDTPDQLAVGLRCIRGDVLSEEEPQPAISTGQTVQPSVCVLSSGWRGVGSL